MGIERIYKYIYYTFINNEFHEILRKTNEDILFHQLSSDNIFDYIENKFKENQDETVKNFKIESAQFSDNIDSWIKNNIVKYKQMPIFIQFQENQQIKLNGPGQLFKLYEKEDEVSCLPLPNSRSISARYGNNYNGPDSINFFSGGRI